MDINENHKLLVVDDTSNEIVSVWYESDVPCVVMMWRGYVNSKQFRYINEQILAFIVENRVNKVLADVTALQMVGADDQRWLNEDWLPRAIAAGFKVGAMINSKFYFSKVAIETVVANVDTNRLTVEYFQDQGAARAWLKQFDLSGATSPAGAGA